MVSTKMPDPIHETGFYHDTLQGVPRNMTVGE